MALPGRALNQRARLNCTVWTRPHFFFRRGEIHERLEETIAAVERLQQEYAIQVQRTAELQAAVDRLVVHAALTTTFGKPHEIE